ncbi:hypothetical protein ACFWBB_30775, partial [Streptomyces sp. NPDC060000]|uniref:hypothetical protein n=1 Tax=Streptomyces sp. NPDC060000 TaxID=3347031 RepID=UPI0036B97C57
RALARPSAPPGARPRAATTAPLGARHPTRARVVDDVLEAAPVVARGGQARGALQKRAGQRSAPWRAFLSAPERGGLGAGARADRSGRARDLGQARAVWRGHGARLPDRRA